jgi:hypothetical protein
MIRPREKPYVEILKRSRLDSGQFTRGEPLLDRITDRVWCMHVYHVAELDSEGYMPKILRDDNWHDIRQWLETRGGIEWLRSVPGGWPQYFEKYLLMLMLRI